MSGRVPRLAHRQREFAAALLDSVGPVPRGLIDPDGGACPKRFAVYRNNVATALIEALEAAFPAVRRIVGDEFFREAARHHAICNPPSSPVMLDYGAGFPAFLEHFEPAASLPYLADVARIERAWSEAYHAAEAAPLDPAALAALPAGATDRIRFTVHPSVRIVRSRHPALTIWRMNVADGVPRPVALEADGEDALVVRPAAEVQVRRMPPGGAELFAALARGERLTTAAQSAIRRDPDFDLAVHLGGLLESGALCGFST